MVITYNFIHLINTPENPKLTHHNQPRLRLT